MTQSAPARVDEEPTAALQIDGLEYYYGPLQALAGISLNVARGEIFGLLGPNGAGKTTTIRTLLDLIRPTSGSTSVLGLDSTSDSVEIRRRVGYLPGDLALWQKHTGRELLEYLGDLRGGVDEGYRDALATRFDLDLDRKVGEYSTGNRQKVGIVQAFMHRPELLILDEPTTGLDPLLQIATYELIEEAREEGRTVFLSSHILPEVERIADRVGIIREGRLLAVENVDELKDRAVRVMEVRFGDEGPSDEEMLAIDGVRSVRRSGEHMVLQVEGVMDALMKALARFEVTTLRSRETDLEEIFLAMYRDGGDA